MPTYWCRFRLSGAPTAGGHPLLTFPLLRQPGRGDIVGVGLPMTEDSAEPESLPLDPPADSRLTNSRATRHHGRHARGPPEAQGVSDQPVSFEDGCPRCIVYQTAAADPNPCRGRTRVFRGLSVRPARGGNAVSARRGRPRRRLLIPRRGRHEPAAPARPSKNLTRLPGVDWLVDVGG